MYPDRADAARLVAPQEAGEIWKDAARLYNFLIFAKHVSHSHGKHAPTSLKCLKDVADEFIGHEVSDLSVMVGAKFAGLIKTFGQPNLSQTVKFPPLNRIHEYREQWQSKLADVEQEIQQEDQPGWLKERR